MAGQLPLQLLVLEPRTPFRQALIDICNQTAAENDDQPPAFREAASLAEPLQTDTFEACILPVLARDEIDGDRWTRLEEAGYTITYFFHLEVERTLTPRAERGTALATRQIVPYVCRTRFGSHHRVLAMLSRIDPVVTEMIPTVGESAHERYRKLLNRMAEGFWDVGPDMKIAYANAAFKSIFEEPNPVGKSLLELFDDDDRARLKSILGNQQEGIIIPFTMRVRGKGKRGKVMQIDPSPRFSRSGQYLGGWALIRDISDQTDDVERSLRQERDLYTLYSVATTLSRGFRLEEMVQAATAAMREQLGVDATCAWVREERADGEGHVMRAVAPQSLDDNVLPEALVKVALSWCEEMHDNRPAVVLRATNKSRNPYARAMSDCGFRSVAAVPLMAGSERIGFLWLACHDPSVMTRDWVSLLISIGHQLALAILNAQSVEARLREESRQKQFYRDAVCAITNGKLLLVDRSEMNEIMQGVRELARIDIRSREDVQNARKMTETVLESHGFTAERIFDVATCLTEAATNTLLHGGGGVLRITGVPADSPDGARIVLEDRGPGINFSELPRAILKRGYSTAISMGLGYTLILDMMDAVYLATDTSGTVLVMEAAQNPVNAELEAWLAKVTD